MNFVIDKEVVSLLPKHRPEEQAGLESLILESQHVDELIVGVIGEERILADGHNRLAICDKHGIEYQVHEMEFETREHLFKWVIENQLGRRNLTDERRAYLMGKEYLIEKKEERGGGDRKNQNGQNVQNDFTAENTGKTTAEVVAERHKVNEKTVRRNAEFAEAVDAIGEVEGEDAKEEILSGSNGHTKKEIVEQAQSLFCERCTKLKTNYPDCPACKRIREEAKKKPRQSKPKSKKPQTGNGRQVYQWKTFESAYGAALRQLDDLYINFGLCHRKGQVKEDAEYKAIREALDTFHDRFKARFETLSGGK